jgi:hypothetical protein
MTDQRERRDHGEGGREMQAANLFDLRRIIGGLFVVYGAILTIVGLTDGQAAVSKAAGVHINLLAGLGMLALGGAFLAWALTHPMSEQLAETEAEMEQGSAETELPGDEVGAGAGRDRERFTRDPDAGRKQPQHVAAEAAPDHPRPGGARPA